MDEIRVELNPPGPEDPALYVTTTAFEAPCPVCGFLLKVQPEWLREANVCEIICRCNKGAMLHYSETKAQELTSKGL